MSSKKVIFRVDDFGLTPAVSTGILDAADHGIISAIGVIVTLGIDKGHIELLRKLASKHDISLGLHLDFVAGKPRANKELVSTLIQESGNFIPSKDYRSKSIVVDPKHVYNEISAQYKLFMEVIGCKPDYLDFHAVTTPEIMEGINEFVKEHDVFAPLMAVDSVLKENHIQVSEVPGNMDYDSYSPKEYFSKKIDLTDIHYLVLVFHAGFVDQRLMTMSSLTLSRMKDAEILSSKAIVEWCHANKIARVNFNALKSDTYY